MSYFVRLFTNLNENTIVNFLIPHLISILGFLTAGMMFYLAVLIYRANPDNAKNRFLSFLLAFEGLGAGALNFFGTYPFPVDYIDSLYSVRYVSGSTGMIRLLFYASIAAFYFDKKWMKSVRALFASKILWLTPIIGFGLFVATLSALGGDVQAMGDMYMLECDGPGEGNNETYGGTEFIFNTTCPASLESMYPLSATKIGVGPLQPILVPLTALFLLVSTVALYRIDPTAISDSAQFDERELRAVRFGFLIKLIFLVGATALIILADSLMNSGDLVGSDIIQGDLFFSSFQSITLFMNIFGSFMMGVLFAYAVLKQDVLGIDEQLRKTFTGTIFAAVGAVSFIAGTEIMENLIGVGWVGAVLMGSVLISTRKPILASISSVSNLLLPEVHTKDEDAYLELYKLAVEDGNVSEKERTMLNLQATAYGLSTKRTSHLEAWYHANEPEETVAKTPSVGAEASVSNNAQPVEPSITHQWTDESGHTWRRMSDGTSYWWSGTDWQLVEPRGNSEA